MTPTERSLKRLREDGGFAAVVEKYIAAIHCRIDLFHWIDIVQVHPQRQGVLGVQTTTSANLLARVKKARGNAALIAWLLAGNRLEAHGWRKLKGHWQVNVRNIVLVDLTPDHSQI